ncbi:MAG: hypothetical protein CBB68_12950 [Rhodospirillaceae bacterium TMED8]|nr:branched-chain amino acid transport [Magnetovibrio sp.]OUT49015.1 MAG: hypothetical protein CBB68_12950 [Rhodospirillaceae bacterium TMED8]
MMEPPNLWATSSLWILTGLCFLGTFVWRAIGIAISTKINPDGKWFQWLNCIAYAMLAGLIARILTSPIGILATTPIMDRALAMAAGLVIFIMLGRDVFAATLIAFSVMLILTAARSLGWLF